VLRRLSQAAPLRRRWLRPAVILGLALVAGAATAASVAVIRGLTQRSAPALMPPASEPPRKRLARSSRAATASSDTPRLVIRAADVPAATKAKVKRKARREGKLERASRRGPAVAAVLSAPAPAQKDAGTFGKETRLFREALSLRANRDPRGAIAVLDRYAVLYPRGSYAAEVVVLRAELAADADDCAAATAGFDRTLAGAASPGLEERALYGRASCRLRAGQKSAARADLERYLHRFPQGRYATHARALLAR
jgi:TolA-binding protein